MNLDGLFVSFVIFVVKKLFFSVSLELLCWRPRTFAVSLQLDQPKALS